MTSHAAAGPKVRTVERLDVAIGRAAAHALLASVPEAPAGLAEHALDPRERVRTEESADARLVVLRVPHRVGTEPPFDTVPLSILFADARALVLSPEDGEVCAALRALPMTAPTSADAILRAALRATAGAFHHAIEEIEAAIDATEARLTRSLVNRELVQLVHHQKALVHHTAALRALLRLLERVSGDPELEEVAVELRQSLEVADLERETLGATMDAFATLVSNNLNDEMRVLTSATIVLTPPIVVAGFWGMNVALPLAASPYAFATLLAISLAASAAVAVALRAAERARR